MVTPLLDLIAGRAPAAAKGLGPPAEAEVRLAALCAEAAAVWPDVVAAPTEVVAALAAALAGDDPPAITAGGLAELHLAVACARGDRAALAGFERGYLDVVPVAVAKLRLSAATVDDIRAAVRERLLVADGPQPPRILGYAGRGRLRGLVQVAATRMAIDRQRLDHREAALPEGDRLAAAGDLELSLIKAQYRAAFSAALAAAVAALDRRDRNLLRLHFLGGVTLEQLATMYGVHRATVVRWLAAARAAVLDGTRARLAAELGETSGELDEVFALVASRIELGLDRLLASVERSQHGGR